MPVDVVTPDSDLTRWASAIEGAEWDAGNEIEEPYTAHSLAAYLSDPTNIFVVAHGGGKVFGMASASLRRKPYGDSVWLYVDEVDVAVPHRRRGVGRELMNALIALALERGCDEVWLGTEADNVAAIGLYRALGADEAPVVGYTFEL